VAISLGANGIVWQKTVHSDPLISRLPAIQFCSSVGCGDAALAGFAVAHERGLGDEEALSLAVACGTANCFADAPGQIDGRDVFRLARDVQVERYHSDHSRRMTVEAQ